MEANKAQVADLARTVGRFGEALRRGQERAFDPVRVGVLAFVVERERARPGEIAEELDVLPSSVTRHVQALVEAGYLVVETDPADRRASIVEATDAGRDQARQFAEAGIAVFQAVIADWSAEDVVTLTGLLDRMIEDWAARGDEQQRAAKGRRRFKWSET